MDADRMRALVAATEGRLGRAWASMLVGLRDESTEAELEAKIARGQWDVLAGRDAGAKLAIGFHAAYIAAGQTSAKWLTSQIGQVQKSQSTFDPTDAPAVQWAAQNRLELVREIDEETRQLVHGVLLEGARTGANPLQMAREIRQSIGITTYQAGIVDNYRRELESGHLSAALERELSSGHSDRAIVAALRANRPLTKAQIDTAVERYRENWIAMRARTIARSDGLRVAHQANEEVLRQAIWNGDLDHEEVERTWVHGPPGKTGRKGDRWFHVSMAGQTREYGEPFESGIGGLLRYPGDPDAGAEETANCGCVVTTRIRPRAGVRAPDHGGDTGVDEDAVAAQAAEMARAADEGASPAPEDVTGLAGGPLQQTQQQALQQAQQRLAEHRFALDSAKAEVARLEIAHAEAARAVDGFRIGVTSEIAGETEADQEAWLAEHGAGLARASQAAEAAQAAGVADAERAGAIRIGSGVGILGEPVPEPPPHDLALPSLHPAPVGFESVEYNGELYYRQRITGVSYTPEQFAERGNPSYALELTGPNAQAVTQYDGFSPLEIKTMTGEPELLYRSSVTGKNYTVTDMIDGYAEGSEQILQAETKKPGILSRVFRALWPEITPHGQ